MGCAWERRTQAEATASTEPSGPGVPGGTGVGPGSQELKHKGENCRDEVQEVMEPDHPGLCSHCRVFWVQWLHGGLTGVDIFYRLLQDPSLAAVLRIY